VPPEKESKRKSRITHRSVSSNKYHLEAPNAITSNFTHQVPRIDISPFFSVLIDSSKILGLSSYYMERAVFQLNHLHIEQFGVLALIGVS